MWFRTEVVNKEKLWKTAELSRRWAYLTCSKKSLMAMKTETTTFSEEKVKKHLLHGLNSRQSIK